MIFFGSILLWICRYVDRPAGLPRQSEITNAMNSFVEEFEVDVISKNPKDVLMHENETVLMAHAASQVFTLI
jgi:hypothetical protein